MSTGTFLSIPERPNFPSEEEKILHYWKETDAFKGSLEESKGKEPYNFYDGPPFATGLPHYGHILAGTIKDVVCRHAHQRGYHVERRFGWDCHGVPVEGIIDAKLKIKGRADVVAFGIDKYNEECRGIVQKYSKEWRQVIERFGRWIDFDNDYKTMDMSYMESTWWCFKELFKKGYVYRAFRVMPYSTALNTPLSNFEVAQNYKEVSDPSIVVKFQRKDRENSWILAWTTTPWTLPSNLALCVHPEFKYLRLRKKDDGQEWLVGKDRFLWVCSCIQKDPQEDFELLEELEGKALVGIAYEPLFSYFKHKINADKAWHIVSDGYVTTGAGTCIVHQAPAFGEDDYRVCVKHGIIGKDGNGMLNPVDDSGCFTADVADYKGVHVKEADKGLKQMLVKSGNMVHNGSEVHNYPHCWRSDTPLIYRAVPAWFIKVEGHNEALLANNDQTYWVPEHVKTKRFHNWLADARDWCVSRSRYWGTPLPIWVSDDFEEVVCIGSVEELEQHTGRKLTDLHRHFIDDIRIPSKMGKGELKRVEEVFDCWFESGAMPYSSKHYPFENKEAFDKGFPANFIAEGLDQTRGWFYTLMVLSTHIFNKPPFKNLICNGLVLASDGKKMSKRLQNYPDPMELCDKYGADAVRMYLCNSPVVRAEPLKFNEDGVRDIVKDVFLPWYNAYRFFIQEVYRYETECGKFVPDPKRIKGSINPMDKWINASMHSLIKFVRQEMDGYRLYTVVGGLGKLLEDLTNWYVRLNRDRMRGNQGTDEALTSLCTLFEVLMNLSVLLAPVVPFITEFLYQNLKRALPDGHAMKKKSVHWVLVPDFDPEVLDDDIERAVGRMQTVVELGRIAREQRRVGGKTPLRKITVFNRETQFVDDIKKLEMYVLEELNIQEIVFSQNMDDVQLTAMLNFKTLGKRLGKDVKDVQVAVKNVGQEDLLKYEQGSTITVAGHELSGDDLILGRTLKNVTDPNLHVNGDSVTLIVLDFTPDEDLVKMALCRDVSNRVQRLRKDAKLQPDDTVDMWAEVVDAKPTSKLAEAMKEKSEYLGKLLRRKLNIFEKPPEGAAVIAKDTFDIEKEKLLVTLTKGSSSD